MSKWAGVQQERIITSMTFHSFGLIIVCVSQALAMFS